MFYVYLPKIFQIFLRYHTTNLIITRHNIYTKQIALFDSIFLNNHGCSTKPRWGRGWAWGQTIVQVMLMPDHSQCQCYDFGNLIFNRHIYWEWMIHKFYIIFFRIIFCFIRTSNDNLSMMLVWFIAVLNSPVCNCLFYCKDVKNNYLRCPLLWSVNIIR